MMRGSVVRRGLLLMAAAVAMPVWCQDAAAGAKTPEYDTVSIKPYQPESDKMMIRVQMLGDRYAASGISVKGLIQYAYNLKTEDQISGAGAVGDKRFNVEAKMDADTVAALSKLSPEERTAQQRLMMQGVLADRFKLKVHRESKDLPIYALVVAKGGPKLKEADPNAAPPSPPNGMKMPDGGPNATGMKMPEGATTNAPNGTKGLEGGPRGNGMIMMSPASMTARGIPIASLANILTMQMHRQVVDKTGLTGKYDIELKFGPEDGKAGMMQGDSPAGTGPVTTDSGPSIFTALPEQLGLKLEATKGPVDSIVVDHLEMPSEN